MLSASKRSSLTVKTAAKLQVEVKWPLMSLINQARQVESYETAIIGGGVVEAAKIKKLIAF